MTWHRCTADDCGIRFKINRQDTTTGPSVCPVCQNTGPRKVELVSRDAI